MGRWLVGEECLRMRDERCNGVSHSSTRPWEADSNHGELYDGIGYCVGRTGVPSKYWSR